MASLLPRGICGGRRFASPLPVAPFLPGLGLHLAHPQHVGRPSVGLRPVVICRSRRWYSPSLSVLQHVPTMGQPPWHPLKLIVHKDGTLRIAHLGIASGELVDGGLDACPSMAERFKGAACFRILIEDMIDFFPKSPRRLKYRRNC